MPQNIFFKQKYMYKVLRVRNNTQARLIPAALLNRMYTLLMEMHCKLKKSITQYDR